MPPKSAQKVLAPSHELGVFDSCSAKPAERHDPKACLPAVPTDGPYTMLACSVPALFPAAKEAVEQLRQYRHPNVLRPLDPAVLFVPRSGRGSVVSDAPPPNSDAVVRCAPAAVPLLQRLPILTVGELMAGIVDVATAASFLSDPSKAAQTLLSISASQVACALGPAVPSPLGGRWLLADLGTAVPSGAATLREHTAAAVARFAVEDIFGTATEAQRAELVSCLGTVSSAEDDTAELFVLLAEQSTDAGPPSVGARAVFKGPATLLRAAMLWQSAALAFGARSPLPTPASILTPLDEATSEDARAIAGRWDTSRAERSSTTLPAFAAFCAEDTASKSSAAEWTIPFVAIAVPSLAEGPALPVSDPCTALDEDRIMAFVTESLYETHPEAVARRPHNADAEGHGGQPDGSPGSHAFVDFTRWALEAHVALARSTARQAALSQASAAEAATRAKVSLPEVADESAVAPEEEAAETTPAEISAVPTDVEVPCTTAEATVTSTEPAVIEGHDSTPTPDVDLQGGEAAEEDVPQPAEADVDGAQPVDSAPLNDADADVPGADDDGAHGSPGDEPTVEVVEQLQSDNDEQLLDEAPLESQDSAAEEEAHDEEQNVEAEGPAKDEAQGVDRCADADAVEEQASDEVAHQPQAPEPSDTAVGSEDAPHPEEVALDAPPVIQRVAPPAPPEHLSVLCGSSFTERCCELWPLWRALRLGSTLHEVSNAAPSAASESRAVPGLILADPFGSAETARIESAMSTLAAAGSSAATVAEEKPSAPDDLCLNGTSISASMSYDAIGVVCADLPPATLTRCVTPWLLRPAHVAQPAALPLLAAVFLDPARFATVGRPGQETEAPEVPALARQVRACFRACIAEASPPALSAPPTTGSFSALPGQGTGFTVPGIAAPCYDEAIRRGVLRLAPALASSGAVPWGWAARVWLPVLALSADRLLGAGYGDRKAKAAKKRTADDAALHDRLLKAKAAEAFAKKTAASLLSRLDAQLEEHYRTAAMSAFIESSAAKRHRKKATAEDNRSRLVRFYEHHAPAKVSDVDSALAKYAGREDSMWRKLVAKYGPEPGPDNTATPTDPPSAEHVDPTPAEAPSDPVPPPAEDKEQTAGSVTKQLSVMKQALSDVSPLHLASLHVEAMTSVVTALGKARGDSGATPGTADAIKYVDTALCPMVLHLLLRHYSTLQPAPQGAPATAAKAPQVLLGLGDVPDPASFKSLCQAMSGNEPSPIDSSTLAAAQDALSFLSSVPAQHRLFDALLSFVAAVLACSPRAPVCSLPTRALCWAAFVSALRGDSFIASAFTRTQGGSPAAGPADKDAKGPYLPSRAMALALVPRVATADVHGGRISSAFRSELLAVLLPELMQLSGVSDHPTRYAASVSIARIVSLCRATPIAAPLPNEPPPVAQADLAGLQQATTAEAAAKFGLLGALYGAFHSAGPPQDSTSPEAAMLNAVEGAAARGLERSTLASVLLPPVLE